ncbi:MAG: response regulator [Acidobacteria bacterium]|jgi:CheY-like chemotaxis protein|nr:response regulator [Acidobacteriota bacterium]
MDNHENLEEEKKSLILIIDDVPKNLQVLAKMLDKKNYRVSIANSGFQALKMIEKVLPDLILLDILMPGMNGIEVCQKLKESPAAGEIPVIFLSAKTKSEDIVEGLKAGGVDYVTKPFNLPELLARVETHLELKRRRDTEKKLIAQLQAAIAQVKKLSGLLPICCKCKKIRDEKGSWHELEDYIQSHSEADFSHGLCPTCSQELYPGILEKYGDR